MKLNGSYVDGPLQEITGDRATEKIIAGTKKGLRRCIRIVMQHHRDKEWVRSAKGKHLKNVATNPNKLTLRSGELLKSYLPRIVDKELAAYYGSDKAYARVHEYGFSGVQNVRSHSRTTDVVWGNKLPQAITFQVRSFSRNMRIRARPGLRRTIKATADQCNRAMADEIAKHLRGIGGIKA